MSIGANPKGLQEVMQNLNREIQGIKGRSMKGLIEAAILIRRDMESTPPLTPVDLGNLRASWFVVTTKGEQTGGSPQFKGRTDSEKKRATEMTAIHSATVSTLQAQAGVYKTVERLYMGFSANYAGQVHEMMGEVAWKRPGSGPKWFEAAIKRNSKRIVEIVRQNARVKK